MTKPPVAANRRAAAARERHSAPAQRNRTWAAEGQGAEMARSCIDQKADELYRALGKAMSRWQYVETGMFLLFHGLSSSSFPESSRQFFETDWKKLRER